MTAEEARFSKIRPVDVESPFAVEELFFSTTDRQGRILSCNDVFTRVSKYALEEMLGRPHNIIRHPDMPRAVFQLFWSTILAGNPIAAYVKNMASDGSYYWVLATVVPIPGDESFLSVRLKPTSGLLGVVEKAYHTLRDIERGYEARGDAAGGLAASRLRLCELLQELGYASYDSFMHAALADELRARGEARNPVAESDLETSHPLHDVRTRCGEVGRTLERQFAAIDGLLALSGEFDEKSRFVNELARSVRLASNNATAAASRLGPTGAALGLIASAIGEGAESGSELAEGLERRNVDITKLLRHAAFHTGVASLQMEMAQTFVDEQIAGSGSKCVDEGLKALVLALDASIREVFRTYHRLGGALAPVADELFDLRRLVQFLQVTHVRGRIEANRADDDAGFGELLSHVGTGVEQAHSELREFQGSIDNTRKGIREISSVEQEVIDGIGAILVDVGR